MAAIIEIKYFNSFWLKKIKGVANNLLDFNKTEIVGSSTQKFTNLPQYFVTCPDALCTVFSNLGDYKTDWAIEESRIRGGYNNTTVDLGVKAYLVEDHPAAQHRCPCSPRRTLPWHSHNRL